MLDRRRVDKISLHQAILGIRFLRRIRAFFLRGATGIRGIPTAHVAFILGDAALPGEIAAETEVAEQGPIGHEACAEDGRRGFDLRPHVYRRDGIYRQTI